MNAVYYTVMQNFRNKLELHNNLKISHCVDEEILVYE